jgi:hypothetical protein
VIEVVAVVIIVSFAKHVGSAVRRLGRQLRHTSFAVIRHTARLLLSASLPAGAVMLELHRDGSVWVIAKAPSSPGVTRSRA